MFISVCTQKPIKIDCYIYIYTWFIPFARTSSFPFSNHYYVRCQRSAGKRYAKRVDFGKSTISRLEIPFYDFNPCIFLSLIRKCCVSKIKTGNNQTNCRYERVSDFVRVLPTHRYEISSNILLCRVIVYFVLLFIYKKKFNHYKPERTRCGRFRLSTFRRGRSGDLMTFGL